MIQQLMEEYYIEIDDVRWYLSVLFAGRLLEHKGDPRSLMEFIWSKKLEDELYDMEERFIKEVAGDYETGRIDEARVREILTEVMNEKEKRYR